MSYAKKIQKPNYEIVIYTIAAEMHRAGLSDVFITTAVHIAIDYQGVYDLMLMWQETEDQKERGEIIADIQDMVDEVTETNRHKKELYIRFDDLDMIAKNILAFKNNLLREVNKRCSLTELSERTGMPLPSLSRFFNTPSMPRRSTLIKIAEALNLSAVEIATEWDYE
jgi:DNA-binding phage protein